MSSTLPFVSVLIPCYNAESYIESSIRSVMNQTYKNIEIVVINDGSTDKTKEVLLKLSKEDIRIEYYENECNLRLVKTLNKGLNLCTGEFIARMDADDICFPNRLEKQVSFLQTNKDVAILGSAIEIFGENVKNIIIKQPQLDSTIKSKMFVASPFHHPTVMFNMRVLKKEHLFYDENYFRIEDYELWIRLQGLNYKFANLKEPLLKYRILSNSESKLLQKNVDVKNNLLFDILNNLFFIKNIDINKALLEKYVLLLNRANFSKISVSGVFKVFDYLEYIYIDKDFQKHFYQRWLAFFVYSVKTLKIKSITCMLFSKRTYKSIYYFLKTKYD